MAFVMVAGPQIISAVFLATSGDWARNSAAYVLGASISISIIVGAAFLLGIQLKDSTSNDTVYWIVLGLLLFLMVRTFRKRGESEPPKWMGKLQEASPKFSFRLGFLLLGVFPTDIITSVAVGSYLSSHGDPFWYYLGFLGLTLLFLATPGLLVLAMGERGKTLLPKVRDWMNTNSWLVSEFVLALFVVITIDSIAG
jgi:threonine/homoserine/homoserine lactone efflux protein